MKENLKIDYAGFWLRLIAFIIDMNLFSIIFIMDVDLWSLGVGMGLYFVLFHISPWRATIGKKLIGIEVLNYKELNNLSLIKAIFRFIIFYITFLFIAISLMHPLTFLIATVPIFMMIFNAKDQTLHDLMAKSIVIDISRQSDKVKRRRNIIVIGFFILILVELILFNPLFSI